MQDMVGMTGFEPSLKANTALHLPRFPGPAALPKRHKIRRFFQAGPADPGVTGS
jgi:hypothetical protein